MTLNNFMYSYALANMLYNVDMNVTDFQEIALIGWNYIGNKRYLLYRTSVDVDNETGAVQLPCDADVIEAVTRTSEDYQYTTNKTNFNNYGSSFTENYIESRKVDKNLFYINGGYVQYTQGDDNIIYVDKHLQKVNVLYRHILVDDEELPLITDKEAAAIAVYVAYILQYKKAIATQNANLIQLAGVLKADWQQKCDAARVDKDIFSQNDLDKILDAKTSFDRKLYGKSYKPLK